MTAVALPSVYWTTVVQPAHPAGMGLAMRPAIACHAVGFYLQKLFLPIGLCVDYGLRPLIVATHWRYVSLGLLVPLAATVLLLARRHRRTLAAAAAIFVAGILPVLGLVPFGFQFWSTVADRYVYLSMLGVALAAAYLITLVPRRSACAAAIAIILGLGMVSVRQVAVWHDTVRLMQQCLRVNPSSAVAYNNLATAFCPTPDFYDYLQATHHPATRPSEILSPESTAALFALADRYFSRSFTLRIEFPESLKNMIALRAGRGQYKEAAALFDLALRLRCYDVYKDLFDPYLAGWIYWNAGRLDRATQLFALQLKQDPTHLGCRDSLARLAAGTPPPRFPIPDTPPRGRP